MPHPPPLAPSSLAQPVRGNPGAWFGADSYPAAAMRRGAEGRAVARLAIGADGRVTGCTIVTSSGDADLDDTTCAIPLREGHFTPALGADGTPAAGTYRLPVRWVLPSDGAAPDGTSSDDPTPRHRNWFERLMVAHHLIGGIVALFVFLTTRIRRRLTGRDGWSGDWPDGDRLPVRSRRPRRLDSRAGRIGKAVAPVVLLAVLLAWLGW